MRLVHQRIELLGTLGVTATAQTAHRLRLEDHFIAGNAGFLPAANAGLHRVADTVTGATHRATAHARECFNTSVAATVTDLRHGARIDHKGAVAHIYCAAPSVLIDPKLIEHTAPATATAAVAGVVVYYLFFHLRHGGHRGVVRATVVHTLKRREHVGS